MDKEREKMKDQNKRVKYGKTKKRDLPSWMKKWSKRAERLKKQKNVVWSPDDELELPEQ